MVAEGIEVVRAISITEKDVFRRSKETTIVSNVWQVRAPTAHKNPTMLNSGFLKMAREAASTRKEVTRTIPFENTWPSKCHEASRVASGRADRTI